MENYRTSRRNVRYKSSSPSPEISESKFRTVHDLVAVLHDEDFPGPWFPPASFGLVTCSPENVGSRPRRTRVAPHCWFFSTENSDVNRCAPQPCTLLSQHNSSITIEGYPFLEVGSSHFGLFSISLLPHHIPTFISHHQACNSV